VRRTALQSADAIECSPDYVDVKGIKREPQIEACQEYRLSRPDKETSVITRRSFVCATAVALALGKFAHAGAQDAPLVNVYKNPACGCCGEWVKHMQAAGFRVETREIADVAPIRQRYGVPEYLASCHTAVVGGYAIEGHVPASDIRRLLREKPKVKGLAVPGMVVGSPGMEQGPPQPYVTLAFDDRGSRIFARH
jgi:hypothetical protein